MEDSKKFMEDNQEQLEYIQALKEAYEKVVENANILSELNKNKKEMNQTLCETLKCKNATIDHLNQKIASLEEEIQTLTEACKKFLQEKQEQHANIQALEEVHAKSVEDAHILLQLIKDKEEMNDTLRETLNYKDTTIDLLRQKNASLQEEIRTVMDASKSFWKPHRNRLKTSRL
ncbi:hypothetical protein WMY93_006237 [Mugilogobius chulae]|uniref:Uncharacterized protein n=1 Tax=Mugilogobius chulae TaxID=88201 RepID=A0AAW0PJ81_9GOBI